MCERSWLGCPNCNAHANHCVEIIECMVIEQAMLDENGQVLDWGDCDTQDPHERYIRCEDCGHNFHEFDEECSDDECECRECDPIQAVIDPEDPNEFTLLRRTRHHCTIPNMPVQFPEIQDFPEIQRLVSDRTLTVLPVRAGRAAEIQEDLLDINPAIPVIVDIESAIPASLKPEEALAA